MIQKVHAHINTHVHTKLDIINCQKVKRLKEQPTEWERKPVIIYYD